MNTQSKSTNLVHVIGCSVFVALNISFALFYNAIGLGVGCLIVLALIWAEKKTSMMDVVKATRTDPATATTFKIAGIIASLTLLTNIVLVMAVDFNASLIIGSGSSGLILAAMSALAYVPFFIQRKRIASA